MLNKNQFWVSKIQFCLNDMNAERDRCINWGGTDRDSPQAPTSVKLINWGMTSRNKLISSDKGTTTPHA